jgi:hypothetical protein
MNELAGLGVGPGPPPVRVGPIQPAAVTAIATSTIVGHAYIKGYEGKTKKGIGRFRVALYELIVSTGDVRNSAPNACKRFKTVRFGVKFDSVAYDRPNSRYHEWFRVVGPPEGEFI